MNGLGTQSIKSNQFVPPQEIPLLGFKSILSWGHNILTLGIYASASTLANEHYIRKLELLQGDLYKQIGDLDDRWSYLENQLTTLLGKVNDLKENDSIPKSFKERADELGQEKDLLADEELNHFEVATSITEIALGPIVFIGQLIANLLTLGFYGVYKNNELKNRISLLKTQNNFIQENFTKQKDQKSENLGKIVNCIHHEILLKENAKVLKTENKTLETDLNGIKNTAPAVAYFELKEVKAEIEELKSEGKKLNLQMSALKAEKQKEEEAKTKAQNELNSQIQSSKVLMLQQQTLTKTHAALQTQLNEKTKELQARENVHSALLQKYQDVKTKADKVVQLESELKKMKDAQGYQSEVTKLSSQLGPIPPKYTPTAKDGESLGAMDVEKHEDQLPPNKVDFSKLYNKRYGKARSAAEVAVESFKYACDQLFMNAENGGMIQLNHSGETSSTFGRFAIYRFMALDLIKGGRISINGCGGHKLDINEDVNLLPSYSENVMGFKKDVSGGLKPIVQLRYKQRDDFTPDENNLELRVGVNPVAVKWILDQLTDEEMGYLFTHLMAPVIPNDHVDYVAMKEYFRIKNDSGQYIKNIEQIERINLVSTASELIQDIATAFQKKFEGNSLIPLFQDIFDDWDIKAYVKEEDNQIGLDKLPDEVVKVNRSPVIVDWELDEDVLSDKSPLGLPRQQDFFKWINKARVLHKTLTPYMGEDLLISPKKSGTEYAITDWDTINSQYHYCHQMIGADFDGNGGERCLFSNLIAIFATDKKEITSENVQKMKNAMAAYLTKLIKARSSWSFHPEKFKKDHLSKEALQLKELADLAFGFEKAILSSHKCTIEDYQKWLRNDFYHKPPIDVSNLTSLEIQLVAYTLGVRIALLPINVKGMGCKVDDMGRILPEAEIFGPNTQELFYMGLWTDPHKQEIATYYGLYPKLNLNNELIGYDKEGAYAAAKLFDDYWVSINPCGPK